MLKVAVLLASYNGQQYIKKQINSIISQKKVELNLFISDDKSTDSTLEIIQSYCDQYKNIQCINKDRIGGPAKNFYFLLNSINKKNFDYVALSDQDDVWSENRLYHAIDQLQQNEALAYSSDVIAVDENEQFIKIIKKSQPQKKYDYIFETPGPGCSFVLTTELVDLINLNFKNNTSLYNFPYHDWLIYALARNSGKRWFIDKEPKIYYRQHQNNFMGANIGYLMRLKRINRILFGDYYRELIFLHQVLLPKEKLNFFRVWHFIFNFLHTRRKVHHSLFMIPFLMILSIQKNDI
jgi:rhamnosyltransferase